MARQPIAKPAAASPPPQGPWSFVRASAGGQSCTLELAIIPNARCTELAGMHDGALRVRLSARPIDGAANECLRKWLAKQLGVPVSSVTVLRGASARRKVLSVALPADKIDAWLQTWPMVHESPPSSGD